MVLAWGSVNAQHIYVRLNVSWGRLAVIRPWEKSCLCVFKKQQTEGLFQVTMKSLCEDVIDIKLSSSECLDMIKNTMDLSFHCC